MGPEVPFFLPQKVENFNYFALRFLFKIGKPLLRDSQVKYPKGLYPDHPYNEITAGICFKFSDNVCTEY
jgi:hypothetical protein